jgi:hypothetical protein
MDVFRVVLVQSVQYTLFPELLEIFGPEKVLKFMDIFGGMTIKVPDRSILERIVRDVDIYVTITGSPDVTEAVDLLSVRHQLPPEYVKEVYQRVKALCSAVGLKR